jgi:hypothetical protein
MYNTLMTKRHLIRGLCLTVLLIPTTVLAFQEPEQVLMDQNNQVYWNPPPSARDTQSTQAAQASSDAALRASEQAAAFSSSSAPTMESSSSLHGAAGSQPSNDQMQQLINALQKLEGSSASTGSDGNAAAALDPVTQRLLLRIKENQMRGQLDAQSQVLASQQSLHGGAPLAGSGPGTTLSLLVVAIAGVWTVWKARRMGKQA